MKKSPLAVAKKGLVATANMFGRVQKTASVAGLSALRVAKGEKLDAYLLKEAFEQMGVTYIKLGQFIASTPSIFPREYVLAFQDCLDQTAPVPFAVIRQVLVDELTTNETSLDDIFAWIDPVPLASASIAQVHKATLKNGQQVALKVQKPDVATIIETDLGVLHSAFWVIEKLLPSMRAANLAPIIDEMRSRMVAETDFLAESHHIDNFLTYLKQTGNTDVVAPVVHRALSTKRVLTMTFLDGRSLIDDGLGLTAEQAKQVMSTVLDTWFLSLMMTGEFHADLHAGNLMLLNNGQVAFLDFGLVGVIDPASLQACFALVQALQLNDYQGMAQAMVGIGMTHTMDKMDVDGLADDLKRMLGKINPSQHNHSDTQQTDHLNTLMLEMADVGKRHGIHFPRDFALLTKQLLYFDRFMLTLAPDMELFEGQRMTIIQDVSPSVNPAN